MVKLPKLDVDQHWKQFWDQFCVSVHEEAYSMPSVMASTIEGFWWALWGSHWMLHVRLILEAPLRVRATSPPRYRCTASLKVDGVWPFHHIELKLDTTTLFEHSRSTIHGFACTSFRGSKWRACTSQKDSCHWKIYGLLRIHPWHCKQFMYFVSKRVAPSICVH